MISRRHFLKATGGSALALASGCAVTSNRNPAEWRNRQTEMTYRPLGRTGFMVSRVVMGGNEITPENYDHVLRSLDSGLNYLDTSPAYGRGRSESGFAKVIRARSRDQFFLTSKVSLWDNNRNDLFKKIYDQQSEAEQKKLTQLAAEHIAETSADDPEYLVNYFGSQIKELQAAALSNVMEKKYGREIDRKTNYRQVILDSVDESLSRLGTDYLDTLMCPHGASSAEELLNFPEIFDAFDHLKKQGKVRYLGVSSHSDPAGVLKAAVESRQYAVAMVAYNIVNRVFMKEALENAVENQVGVIAMKVARAVYPGPGRGDVPTERTDSLNAIVGGHWSPPQKAYLWALRNSHLTGVISNMVNHDQVRENLILPGIAEQG